jgi:hypothetical protein
MFCHNCGAEVYEKAVVCVKCGVGLNNSTSQYNPSRQPMPKTWLVESILATIFCCLPFGIAGIVNAASVSSRYNAGDFEGAQRASQQAGKWTKWSFWLGISVVIIYVLIYVIFGIALVANGFDNIDYRMD